MSNFPKGVNSTAHPQFLNWGKTILENRGLAPGFPMQFQYWNNPAPDRLRSQQGNLNLINFNGPVNIPRVRDVPNPSLWLDVVPDLPFNDLGYGRSYNLYLTLAALMGILGVMLL